ncbi:DUF5125 domain-containing protein [Parabacteroides sp. FAFU027]|uniref:DUF5125 domain-containing protein n=1 Tax=Parabacteroides sp. FAFU027 TaxID=2922715 RepID=UPI001FB0332F|nr:DUF5125 domain-containing protein [Parabacteroides sp. FAFU027]
MRKYLLMQLTAILLLAFSACSEKEQSIGNPVIDNPTVATAANFGDSVTFSANVSDNIPLSTLKAQLYYGDEKVSETVIRTKTNGIYSGKIFVPYYANVPNATATVKLVLQNINFTITNKEFDLPVTRPDYDFLTLVMEDKTEVKMLRTAQYQYKATAVLPQKFKAYIKTPVLNAQGNSLTFGWENSQIAIGSTSLIPFSNATAGTYDVTFNTLTCVASPFIKLMFNGTEMTMVDDNNYKVEMNLTKGQVIEVSGFPDYANWWIDPDYFTKGSDGKLTFLPESGKYRVTANFAYKFFIIERMNGTALSQLNTDGNAVYLIGWGVGKPSASARNINWDPSKGLCMAKVGTNKFQVTIKPCEMDGADFKFFYQKGWGGEFVTSNYTSYPSDLMTINATSGNFKPIKANFPDPTRDYVITLDLSGGNTAAVLTMVAK